MQKFNAKLIAAASLAAVLAVACGGDDHVAAVVPPAPDPALEAAKSVQLTVDYLNGVIAGTNDASDPVNIDGITLASDDTAEPTAL